MNQTKWEDEGPPDRWFLRGTTGMLSPYRYHVVKRWNCTII